MVNQRLLLISTNGCVPNYVVSQSSVMGMRCAKTEGEVSIGNGSVVKVVRKNTRNNTNYHYGNQTLIVYTDKKKFSIQDLYRRGVRQYGFGTVLYVSTT